MNHKQSNVRLMMAELHTKNGTFLKRFAVKSADPMYLDYVIAKRFPATHKAGFLVYVD